MTVHITRGSYVEMLRHYLLLHCTDFGTQALVFHAKPSTFGIMYNRDVLFMKKTSITYFFHLTMTALWNSTAVCFAIPKK